MSLQQALAQASSLKLGGYTDWRVPTMKELYTLSDFDGVTGQSQATNTPYWDKVFETKYGTTRHIDGQVWSQNKYVDTVFNGQTCYFGFNPIDGRIKV